MGGMIHRGDEDAGAGGVYKGHAAVAADEGRRHRHHRRRPHAQVGHEGEQAPQQLVPIGPGQPQANAHLHHQGGGAQGVKAVGQGGLQHGGRAVNPDQIHVQPLGQGHQALGGVLIDAHLGDFPEKHVAGVDIHAHICPGQILNEFGRHILRHGPALAAGEGPVHVQVAQGDPPGHGADAQRVQGRIEIHGALEVLRVLVQNSGQPPGHILSLQLVPVGAGDYTEPFAAAANAVLLNHQVLPHRQGKLYHVFDHTTNFFLSHCCRLTRMNTRWVCSGGPKNTPRSMGQSQ